MSYGLMEPKFTFLARILEGMFGAQKQTNKQKKPQHII